MIRGDLSVITNDLTYLAGIVPPGEVERAKTRCANIAQFLGKLSVLQNGSALQECSLAEFARSCLESEVADAVREQGLNRVVRCDLQQARFVFATVAGLIAPQGVAGVSRGAVDIEADVCTIVRTQARIDEPVRCYSTLSDFASGARGERAVVDAALCDLVLQTHGWSARATVTDVAVEISVVVSLGDGDG